MSFLSTSARDLPVLFWFESINDELMATVLLFEEIGANNRRQLMPGPRLRLHGQVEVLFAQQLQA